MSSFYKRVKESGLIDLEDEIKFEALPFEIFIQISDNEIKNIKPGYFVSNYARVYSNISKKIIRPKVNKQTGYYSFTVACFGNPKQKDVSLHRILMLLFIPIEDPENYVVNHKDGNKLHTTLDNLEWVTPKENMMHAARTNLLHPVHGENHVCAKINEETCRKICELLESRKYQNKKIAELLGIPESIVSSIREGRAWKVISKDYKLDYEKERISKIFTYEQLCSICEYFQNNPKGENVKLQSYLKEALMTINFNRIDDSTLNSIRKLYKKERWKYIYSKYNY